MTSQGNTPVGQGIHLTSNADCIEMFCGHVLVGDGAVAYALDLRLATCPVCIQEYQAKEVEAALVCDHSRAVYGFSRWFCRDCGG